MTVRRGYSDSKLTKILKPKFDEDNLDNFLPKFLLKEVPKDDMEIPESDKVKAFFDSNESDEFSECLKNLSIKEVRQKINNPQNVNTQNINQNEGKVKIPRSKFYSNMDLKQQAKNQKNDIYNQFQSQMGYNGSNFHINYNINQNISQSINKAFQQQPQSPVQMHNERNKWNGGNKFNQGLNGMGENWNNYGDHQFNESPMHLMKMHASSPNDSGIFSYGSDFSNSANFFPPLRPAPKKNYSCTNVRSGSKAKSSLFLNVDKEEKGDDFADLDELINSISEELWDYAKTQRGSRNLQKLLNKIQPESLDVILEKIKSNFPELMIDTYGNYFCQKLIQSSSSEQRMFILRHIMTDFTDIACNASGTHALQSLIEIINMPGEEDLVKEAVKDNILKLSYDINGTHVIQKVISCIDEENREFINFTILKNIHKLIYDSNGICVLKKFINGNKNYSLKKYLLDEITKNALEIVQNAFGNYVIQHILNEWGPEVAKDIINVIISNMVSLSMQKFSSNVVEKCFDLVDAPTRKRMVKELFNAGKISSLLKNKYGNFVLQKAIAVMSNDEKKEIKEYLAERVAFTSNKEKARLNSLIEIM